MPALSAAFVGACGSFRHDGARRGLQPAVARGIGDVGLDTVLADDGVHPSVLRLVPRDQQRPIAAADPSLLRDNDQFPPAMGVTLFAADRDADISCAGRPDIHSYRDAAPAADGGRPDPFRNGEAAEASNRLSSSGFSSVSGPGMEVPGNSLVSRKRQAPLTYCETTTSGPRDAQAGDPGHATVSGMSLAVTDCDPFVSDHRE